MTKKRKALLAKKRALWRHLDWAMMQYNRFSDRETYWVIRLNNLPIRDSRWPEWYRKKELAKFESLSWRKKAEDLKDQIEEIK